jgi:hypothetical protein
MEEEEEEEEDDDDDDENSHYKAPEILKEKIYNFIDKLSTDFLLYITPNKSLFLPNLNTPKKAMNLLEIFLTVNLIGEPVLMHFIGKLRRYTPSPIKIHKFYLVVSNAFLYVNL